MIRALVAWLRALLTLDQQPGPTVLAKLPGVYGARVAFGRWLSDADMARIRAVPALRSAWVGYDSGGFDWPGDVEGVGAINVQLTPGRYDGLIEWYAAPSAPDVLWVLVYATPGALDWTCDAAGNHCGTHPTGAWVVDAGRWMSAVGQGE